MQWYTVEVRRIQKIDITVRADDSTSAEDIATAEAENDEAIIQWEQTIIEPVRVKKMYKADVDNE